MAKQSTKTGPLVPSQKLKRKTIAITGKLQQINPDRAKQLIIDGAEDLW